jgi:hypothetical protein
MRVSRSGSTNETLVLVAAGLTMALCVLVGLETAPVAFAASGPSWAIKSVAVPTDFPAEDTKDCKEEAGYGCDSYLLTVTNVGTGPSSGPVVVKDHLPRGVVVAMVRNGAEEPGGGVVRCSKEVGASLVRCEYEGSETPIPPEGVLTISVEVTTTPEAASTVTNMAEVEGGGAATAVTAEPSTVPNTVNSMTPPAFGVQDFSVGVLGSNGASDVQAGDHPATITATTNYTTILDKSAKNADTSTQYLVVQEPKTELVNLPLGFTGDPLAAAQCPESVMVQARAGKCPPASQVGDVTLEEGISSEVHPMFSVVPESGYPAEFGFEFDESLILLRVRVLPARGGYILSEAVPDIPRSTVLKLTGVTVTFFGDPTERDGSGDGEAFVTNPDACEAGPLKARLEVDSWVDPSNWQVKEAPVYEAGSAQAVTGCGALQFEPSLEVVPTETQADTPSGYEIDLKVPQAQNVGGFLATPDLKNAQVTLPQGVAVSPSAADGLAACREVGPEGINITHNWTPTGAEPLDPADPEAMEIGADGLPHVAPGHCPRSSQLGEVEIVTPVLPSPLHGHVYLAEPQCGGEGQPPCTEASATNGELYGLYLEAEGSGVIVKLKGAVAANPTTGQLTTTFKDNPQFPFSELKLRVSGGERAPLANPQTCGGFTTTSDLTPWSAPVTPDATPSSPPFTIGGCASSMPFAPSFSAHTVNASAAASSPFTVTFSRHDGEQDLSGVSVTMPPGLVGLLSEVPLCEEPQAAAGSCSEASQIGTTTVAAGAGSEPFWISGHVYLTGPYNGAPFGLSVVVPAKAGPFNLGNVVVRAAINVNPTTAAVTVTSGPLPQLVDGVPLRTQTVNVLVNRQGFLLNPTNCEQQSVTGKFAAAQGATASVSSPFAVEGCKSLPFKPSFTASTQAKTSKTDGASLDVKVGYPPASKANIRSVKVDLPLALPSRLTTLHKACPAAVFEANPATCPPESAVGIVRATTPVLPVALMGPAYLVSHGGEAFPNLVVVLQGDGVRVNLVGATEIKKGITSSTFRSIPDVPVNSFELYLPEGKYSVLAANGNLCKQKLAMPTAITGQNGSTIKQTTTIKVTGCPKAKKTTAKKAGKAKKARDGRRAKPTAAVTRRKS